MGGETPPLQSPSSDARAARVAKFKREQLVVDYLNRGVSVAEIAARFGVGEKRMRAIIREILARRVPAPPHEFVAIQVSRLNEALLVAYSAMGETNLKAVDRVVKIVRELDRYHGFVTAESRRREPSRIEPPVDGAMTFGAALGCRPEFALQDAERVEFAPGPGTTQAQPGLSHPRESRGPGAAMAALTDPSARLDLDARFREHNKAPLKDIELPLHAPQSDQRPENLLQSFENIHSAPGIATPPGAENPNQPGLCHPRESGGPGAAAATLPDPSARLEMDARFREHDKAPPKNVELTSHAPQSAGRPENPPQDAENAQSAPGSSAASAVPPTVPTPGGFRRVNCRMTLNGAAC